MQVLPWLSRVSAALLAALAIMTGSAFAQSNGWLADCELDRMTDRKNCGLFNVRRESLETPSIILGYAFDTARFGILGSLSNLVYARVRVDSHPAFFLDACSSRGICQLSLDASAVLLEQMRQGKLVLADYRISDGSAVGPFEFSLDGFELEYQKVVADSDARWPAIPTEAGH